MKRKYETIIQDWIDYSKKCLLIYGARQVGKTYLVRHMLDKNNISYFEINFQERQDILQAISNLDSAEEISSKLTLYSSKILKQGKSVIFFDEVQLFPDIITKIKFLVEEGKYRYILSGSNLGVELKGIKSIPVGYVEMFQMFPMDLFEFSYALGLNENTISYIKECFDKLEVVDDVIHKKMIKIFYYYLLCGGMPAVVNALINDKNLKYINNEKKQIIEQYKADFVKYEADDKKLKIISIFDSIPSQLNQQNKRFIFTELNKELKFNRYENSFLWLKDAAVAIPVYIANSLNSPLIINKSTNLFKLFMADVGILTSCYPSFVSKQLLEMNKEKQINNGALFENFVAQELLAHGIIPYYFKNKKIGEIDFVIEYNGSVVPIEIKSGSDFKKHKALDNLISNDGYRINKSYVFSLFNVKKEESCVYLPIYMVGLMNNHNDDDFSINLENI